MPVKQPKRVAIPVFTAVKGSRLSNKDARVVGSRIWELNGGGVKAITKYDVYNDAKSPRSPLHRFFDWDRDVAAEKWNLTQAQNLLNSFNVTVVYKKGNKTEEFITKGVHKVVVLVNGQRQSEYHAMPGVMNDKDSRAQILANARRDMELFVQRYGRFQFLDKIVKRANLVLKMLP